MVFRDEIKYEDLESIPRRKWLETIKTALVYVFPSKRIHDSGFACMDFVAVLPDLTRVRFGGGCDSVSFFGKAFQMDCMPNGIIRIFNQRGFTVSCDVSSIFFYEEEAKMQIHYGEEADAQVDN